jgi:L-2-hydroxyglutarate oxidase LhgO
LEHYKVDVVVVGAGVVGIAVARALALQGREVWLIEKEKHFGMGTSSRNSEVIHAGIYYPEGSLKAKMCVRGKALLYSYLDSKSIPYERCGKLIVAQNEQQLERLQGILVHGHKNGVEDLRLLSETELHQLEPEVNAIGAIHSPSTGIVDSHELMLSLLQDAQEAGAELILNTSVEAVSFTSEKFVLELCGQDAKVEANALINAAGLAAPFLVQHTDGFDARYIPLPKFAKGSYFSYSGRAPFKHLIYPVPEPGGLGVHLTRDLGGGVKFGPDVQWHTLESKAELEGFDYTVDASKQAFFAEKVREYWPSLDEDKLQPAYSGLRPKLQWSDTDADGKNATDFVIQTDSEHGLKGLVNLFGIESPGLTSCLAIAEAVAEAL